MKKIKSFNYRLAAASSGSDINQFIPVTLHKSKFSDVKYRIIRNGKMFTGCCRRAALIICK